MDIKDPGGASIDQDTGDGFSSHIGKSPQSQESPSKYERSQDAAATHPSMASRSTSKTEERYVTLSPIANIKDANVDSDTSYQREVVHQQPSRPQQLSLPAKDNELPLSQRGSFLLRSLTERLNSQSSANSEELQPLTPGSAVHRPLHEENSDSD